MKNIPSLGHQTDKGLHVYEVCIMHLTSWFPFLQEKLQLFNLDQNHDITDIESKILLQIHFIMQNLQVRDTLRKQEKK